MGSAGQALRWGWGGDSSPTGDGANKRLAIKLYYTVCLPIHFSELGIILTLPDFQILCAKGPCQVLRRRSATEDLSRLALRLSHRRESPTQPPAWPRRARYHLKGLYPAHTRTQKPARNDCVSRTRPYGCRTRVLPSASSSPPSILQSPHPTGAPADPSPGTYGQRRVVQRRKTTLLAA